MDKKAPAPENTLLTAAIKAVEALGLRVGIADVQRAIELDGRDRVIDAVVDVQYGGHRTQYKVETKQGLRPGTLGTVLHKMRDLGPDAMLVTDYVTPNLAQELRHRKIPFMDAAGNVYLETPDFLIWVKGERPPTTPAIETATGRAFTTTGLQVLFALLCAPKRTALPYREIGALAGVAHGTVGWVMAELTRLGFVATVPHHGRRLVNARELLDQWVQAYARTLRPKIVLGRFRATTLDWATADNALRYDLALGGEPAANHLTHYLRPGTATFYGGRIDPRLLFEQGLRPDPKGNVEVLRRFWTFKDDEPGLVPVLLVYADLLAIGDARCLETAKLLYEPVHDRFK